MIHACSLTGQPSRGRAVARRWLAAVLLFAAIRTVGAQSTSRSAANATIVTNAELRAIADRPDTVALFDSVARVVAIDAGYNVGIAVVRRSRVGDTTPPDALSHGDITEVYHIVEGNGVFVSGGTIVNGAPMAADSRAVLRLVGPSTRGTTIRGGVSRSVGPGDVIVVPPNTAHGFATITTARIVYLVVRVDPHRLLPVTPP